MPGWLCPGGGREEVGKGKAYIYIHNKIVFFVYFLFFSLKFIDFPPDGERERETEREREREREKQI